MLSQHGELHIMQRGVSVYTMYLIVAHTRTHAHTRALSQRVLRESSGIKWGNSGDSDRLNKREVNKAVAKPERLESGTAERLERSPRM